MHLRAQLNSINKSPYNMQVKAVFKVSVSYLDIEEWNSTDDTQNTYLTCLELVEEIVFGFICTLDNQ